MKVGIFLLTFLAITFGYWLGVVFSGRYRPELDDTAARAVADIRFAAQNTQRSLELSTAFERKLNRCIADNARLAREIKR